MGGPEGIARQHARGKLTVRERIEKLTDPESFSEFGALVGAAGYEGDQLTSFTPKGAVEGVCRLNGRKVILSGGYFTISGGGGAGGLGRHGFCGRSAGNQRLPGSLQHHGQGDQSTVSRGTPGRQGVHR